MVIVINAITLGPRPRPPPLQQAGGLLLALDRRARGVRGRALLKLYVHRLRFFRSGWNVFDFTIVAITLAPTGEGLQVLRSLRILRACAWCRWCPMRKVVNALLRAIPAELGAHLLLLVFYCRRGDEHQALRHELPGWFGSYRRILHPVPGLADPGSWSMGTPARSWRPIHVDLLRPLHPAHHLRPCSTSSSPSWSIR